MHQHLEELIAAIAARLERREPRPPRARRRRGPRVARGTFVPVAPSAGVELLAF